MRHYRIEITELAEQDLENAGDHIAYNLKNPTAAVVHMLVDSKAWLYRAFGL